MVTSCAVCTKNLTVSLLLEIVRNPQLTNIHHALKSAGNRRKRKQLKIFQIKQHQDPVTLTAYNLSALYRALCHQKEHVAVSFQDVHHMFRVYLIMTVLHT